MFLFQSPQHLSTDRLSDLSDLSDDSDDSDWLGWMIGRVVKIKKTGNLMIFSLLGVPKKGLEPSRLATHAPETCASTIPPLGHFANAKLAIFF